MAGIQDILNEKSLEIILNFKPSDKYDKNAVNEILKLKGDIKKIITLLPKQEQEILDLRYFQNLSDEKIAERFSKPKDEINKIISQSVKNVKEKLGQDNLILENVQKVIEVPNVKERKDIRVQNQQKPAKQAVPQVQAGIKKRPSFFAFVFSLAFYAAFFAGGYFIVQKYFFHNLPPIQQLLANFKDPLQKSKNVESIKGKKKAVKSPKDIYSVKIAGSSSLFIIAKRWENAFNIEYPKYHIDLISSDSNKGINGLLEGIVDIANSSRPVNSFDRRKASENGFELLENRVALDALIIIVNSKNPMNEISLDSLEKVFSREQKNWKEVYSEQLFDNPIVPIIREKGSGTNDFVTNRILEGNDFPSSVTRKTNNQDLLKLVSENEGAIGFINSTAYPWENKNIKYLNIKNYDNSLSVSPFEGHKLNENAVRYGDYPLAHYLYLITRSDAPKKVQDFVSWVLSKSGQQIVSYSGLIPVSKSED